MSAAVSAVIVAYNSAADLNQLLPLLADPRVEVVVVENDSADDSLAVAAAHRVITVPMGRNTGWSVGCNTGAARATAPVLAFVNPDTRPTPEDLVALASALRPGVVTASPVFVNPDGTPQSFCFRFPSPISGLMVFFNAGRRLDRLIGNHFLRRRTYDHGKALPPVPDHTGAACLVIRREDFMALGGFDERMFLFFSDTDLARRSRALGTDTRVVGVQVRHQGGASVATLPARERERLFQRDYLAYADGAYGPVGRLVTRMGAWVLGALLPSVAKLMRRRRA